MRTDIHCLNSACMFMPYPIDLNDSQIGPLSATASNLAANPKQRVIIRRQYPVVKGKVIKIFQNIISRQLPAYRNQKKC